MEKPHHHQYIVNHAIKCIKRFIWEITQVNDRTNSIRRVELKGKLCLIILTALKIDVHRFPSAPKQREWIRKISSNLMHFVCQRVLKFNFNPKPEIESWWILFFNLFCNLRSFCVHNACLRSLFEVLNSNWAMHNRDY